MFSLGYDFHSGNGDNGNVFAITNYKDNSRNQGFTYDSLNRLTSAQNAGTNCSATTVNGKTEYWGNTYGYDAWGNLTDKTKTKCNAEDIHFTVDAHNWLHVLAGADYAYDAAGNMTYNANGAQSYSYDQENRITGAAGYTYTYDGDGNRVEKSNGSTGTLYWYMSPGIVAESDLGGNLKSEYVFFDGERVARKDFPGLAVSYYFSDHLKTTDIVTDASGNIKNESDFYPWGGELEFLANDSNHYKFTGKERDSETGLDYFGARYYSNGLGRFVTPDWAAKAAAVPYAEFADPQSLNLYSYVRNVPTTRYDADGHCAEDACIVEAGIGIGAAVASIAGPVATGMFLGWAYDKASSLIQANSGTQSNRLTGGHHRAASKTKPGKGSPAPGTHTKGGKGSTLRPGPHAGESIPARSKGRDFTAGERDKINEIGKDTGCHTCGSKDAGTKSGNFVPDHQPPNAIAGDNADQRLYPQCISCSHKQGGETKAAKDAEAPKEQK